MFIIKNIFSIFLFRIFLILYIKIIIKFIINYFNNISKYYKLSSSYNKITFNILFTTNYFNFLNK